jgi:hypothetical protein
MIPFQAFHLEESETTASVIACQRTHTLVKTESLIPAELYGSVPEETTATESLNQLLTTKAPKLAQNLTLDTLRVNHKRLAALPASTLNGIDQR